jgi:RNA polymerase sigma factor (sigma-70 family)
MDENWPLFAARLSGRPPTENEARLLEASRRLWPSALAFATSKVSELPTLAPDARGLTTQIWEETLFSVLGTMEKLGTSKISDLDSYLFAIFRNRLHRYIERERKRRRIIEFVPSTAELEALPGSQDPSWVERLESEVLVREALARMDETFRVTAWFYCRRYSWDEIGRTLGLTKEQARKRFEYGLRKLRKLLGESSGK